MRGTVRRQWLNGKPRTSKKTGQPMWQIGFEVGSGGGKRQRKWNSYTGTKKDAETELRRLINDEAKGVVEKEVMNVAEFLDHWLGVIKGKNKVGQKSYERYEQMVKLNINPRIIKNIFPYLNINSPFL